MLTVKTSITVCYSSDFHNLQTFLLCLHAFFFSLSKNKKTDSEFKGWKEFFPAEALSLDHGI